MSRATARAVDGVLGVAVVAAHLVTRSKRDSAVVPLPGAPEEPVAQLQKAAAIDPNNVRPIADLAWLLAVCPDNAVRDGPKAVALAQRACVVTAYKNPVLLNTLAAAYAEVGDSPQAVATATKALDLVEPQDRVQAQWIAGCIERYRAGKPFRPAAEPSPK